MNKNIIIFIFIILFCFFNWGISEEKKDPIFYLFTDELPKFGDTDTDLYNYIYKNLKWPTLFDGTDQVLVSFVVTKTGKIEGIKVEKSQCKECAIEVKNVLSNMPLWKPGKKDGEYVSVKIFLPIIFAIR